MVFLPVYIVANRRNKRKKIASLNFGPLIIKLRHEPTYYYAGVPSSTILDYGFPYF